MQVSNVRQDGLKTDVSVPLMILTRGFIDWRVIMESAPLFFFLTEWKVLFFFYKRIETRKCFSPLIIVKSA